MCEHSFRRIVKVKDLSEARMSTIECTDCGKRRIDVKHKDGGSYEGDWYKPKTHITKSLYVDPPT